MEILKFYEFCEIAECTEIYGNFSSNQLRGLFCDPFEDAKRARQDVEIQKCVLKALRKAVPAFSRPRIYRSGDKIFGKVYIPIPCFVVFIKGKSRFVTDFSRRPLVSFDLSYAQQRFPEHSEWLSQLYAKTGG